MPSHITRSEVVRIESLEPMVLMSVSINGTDAGEWISGDESDNDIQAFGGDDEIYAPIGNNTIDGGTGTDTFVIYEGNQFQFSVVKYADGVVVIEGPGLNGQINTNQLKNVERIQFNDSILQVANIPVTGEPPVEPPVEPPLAGVTGTDASEWISGTDENDIIDAKGGDDEIYAPIGNNFVFGGSGTDTFVVYEGNASEYEVVKYADGVVQVTGPGLNGVENVNVLVDMERILFNDGAVELSSLPVSPGTGPTLPGGPVDPPLDPPVVPEPGVIGLANSVLTVDENAGSVDVEILRSGGSDGAITVDYQTFAASATAGVDFQPVAGTVGFADGQTSAIISVPIINDNLAEGNEAFGFTIDNVNGGATLLAPRTATITILDDEASSSVLFDFNAFSTATGLNLNGDASVVNNRLRLTTTDTDTAGSVFLLKPLEIDADTSFSTQFTLQISGGTDGADGLAFVIQNSVDGSAALGQTGGEIGYGGVTKSLAIEFDTYTNGSTDPNNNHIDILRDGNTTSELAFGIPAIDLNGGAALTAWVEYDGVTNLLEVFLSDNGSQSATPVVSTTVDLANVLGSQAYLGFTAGTGGLTNVHEILDWEFSSNSELLPAPATPLSLIGENVVSGLIQPTAVDWSPDGEVMYVSEQRGVVKAFRDGTQSTFVDFTDEVNGTRDRGLLDIAVHPDFENNPYVYLLYTYDPPEVYDNLSDNLAGPDENGNRAGRLTRVTADVATNYTAFVEGSEVTLLGANSTWDNFNAFVNSTTNFNEPAAGFNPDGSNIQDFIASDSESHTVGGVEFGPDGALYVTIGDGASYNRLDARAVRVQDIDNLSGKVLRVDPLTGDGLADNPFFNGDADANRSKVYQLGLRNSFRLSIDPTNGNVYTGDVGWGSYCQMLCSEKLFQATISV